MSWDIAAELLRAGRIGSQADGNHNVLQQRGQGEPSANWPRTAAWYRQFFQPFKFFKDPPKRRNPSAEATLSMAGALNIPISVDSRKCEPRMCGALISYAQATDDLGQKVSKIMIFGISETLQLAVPHGQNCRDAVWRN